MNFGEARVAAEAKRKIVTQQVAQLFATAQAAFEQSFTMPEILFNQRGAIAGSARYATWQLRFQPQLLLAHFDTFQQQIIPHEVAHLVVHQVFGRVQPHGAQWRYVMSHIFFAPPHRTHNLTVQAMQKRTFRYKCGCPEPHELTIRRHNRICKQQAVYRCKRCGEVLTALPIDN